MENYKIQQTVTIDFVRAGVPPRVYAKQYDNNMRIIAIYLCSDGLAYAVPDGYGVNIRLLKPDGTRVYNPALEISGSTAYIVLTQQMLAVPGSLTAEIEIVKNADRLKSAAFYIVCDASAVPEEAVESTDEYITVQQLAEAVAINAKAAQTAQEAAKTAATEAEKAKEDAAEAAKTAGDAATKIINEGITEKLEEIKKLDNDITQKTEETKTAAETAVNAKTAAADAAASAAGSLEGANNAQAGAQGYAADALAAAQQAKGYAGAATTALGYDSNGILTFYYDDGSEE